MILPSLRGVSAQAWNAIAGTEHPFVRYEFLAALEQQGCLQPYGWQPAHVLVHQGRELVGALPLYLTGLPTLSLAFFETIGRQMPEHIVLVMAHQHGRYVAGALNLRGDQTLYGRYWGCREQFRYLHFELCYYQTLEYCIQKGLQCFEAGAQGEHKLSRGFLPYTTWSAHWLADERFAQIIQSFVAQERLAVHTYIDELRSHSPFKRTDSTHRP